MRARPARGAGLLEVLVVAAVLVVLATQALPAAGRFMERRRVQSVASALYDDMRFAQSEALRRNTPVYFAISAGSPWCYGFSVAAGCNCNSPNSCELRTQASSAFPNTALATTTGSGSFDPAVGGASAVTVSVSALPAGNLAKGARFNMGLAGLMSVCSPAGGGFIPDYPAC